MFCWIKYVQDIRWIDFKVKIIEKQLIKSTKFVCCTLMIKCTSKTMDMMD